MSYLIKRSPYCIITDDGEGDYTEEHLAHHGVKGQKWGVIHEEDNVGNRQNSSYNSQARLEREKAQRSRFKPGTYRDVELPLRGVSFASVSRSTLDDKGNKISYKEPKFGLGSEGSLTCDMSINKTGKDGKTNRKEMNFQFDASKYKDYETAMAGLYADLTAYLFNNDIYVTDDMFKYLLHSLNKGLKIYFAGDKVEHSDNYSERYLAHSSIEVIRSDDILEHHGILGMKWGVRRYQNADGSLTDAGRKHYGRNYTIHELKKNVQNAKTYEEKKAAVTANKVNRITKTPYRQAATTVATAGAGLASSGAIAGLMAAGLISVNPLLPVAALAGGVAAGKAINTGRDIVNMFRNLRAEQIDRKIDKQHFEESGKKITVVSDPTNSGKGMYAIARAGELPESTRVTGKEESDFWKAYAKQYESQAKTSGSSNSAKPSQERSSNSRLYTPEQQKSKMERAKNNDEYDMYFLEAMQNTKVLDSGTNAQVQKAYKEYLKDPDKFFTDPDFDKKYPYA